MFSIGFTEKVLYVFNYSEVNFVNLQSKYSSKF